MSKLGKRGKHEWLDVYVGLGCYLSENGNHFSLLTSDLFCWDAANKPFKSRKHGMKCKHNCAAYLLELRYDLMLSSASSVSQSLGFEILAGQH